MGELSCKNIIAGDLKLELLHSNNSISFVGGINIETGCIADPRHDRFGECITGKAFAFPFGKGSSGAGLVLMEMLRTGTAPAAIINIRTETVVLTGPLICKHFYKQILPIVNVSEEDYQSLSTAKNVEIFKDKEIILFSN